VHASAHCIGQSLNALTWSSAVGSLTVVILDKHADTHWCGFFNSLHPGQARRHTLDHKAQGNTYRAIKIRSNVASCPFIEVKHNNFHARASDCRRVRPAAAGRLANTTRALAAACRARCPPSPPVVSEGRWRCCQRLQLCCCFQQQSRQCSQSMLTVCKTGHRLAAGSRIESPAVGKFISQAHLGTRQARTHTNTFNSSASGQPSFDALVVGIRRRWGGFVASPGHWD
jgi:hypothetical protein